MTGTYIVDPAGRVIRRSRNLRGILEHARRHGVAAVNGSEGPQGEYLARFEFENGDVGRAAFMDWRVLRQFLDARRSWGSFERTGLAA